MGKISPVSAKYIIHSIIEIDGVVDKPDVIGAIFGQTEGLLGADLELRELQKSGKIGRIEVNTETRNGKTRGTIIVPSSLDKAETSIIGAALEIIQRIGPCNAKLQVQSIEDVRVNKRNMVVERAKALLKRMMETVMPDSQELADEVAASVRVMEIQEYGVDRLPAGPSLDESDEVIVVEGRADVINMLKHGFKNVIALNGSSVPSTIIELSKKKVITGFVDGDRGGNLILKELTAVADIDYVAKAPDGKEVEEITKKEIHKALRSRISAEQAKFELSKEVDRISPQLVKPQQGFQRPPIRTNQNNNLSSHPPAAISRRILQLTSDEKQTFKRMLEDLIGTKGAEVVDTHFNVLGKVPISELQTALKSISNVHAIIFDGIVDKDLVKNAESSNVKYIVARDSHVRQNDTKISIVSSSEL